jgi:bifunctional UDP-N-acetylglucosamine pyrophosphorylase/glucosamine-1-phosphate N-acetyltransferase
MSEARMALNVIVLAGGSGTRMASKQPKVLHLLGGKTLLDHVLDAVAALNPAKTFVVYGHMGDVVLKAMVHRQEKLTWVEQEERLGTGHAVQQVLPQLKNANDQVLILCGDVPLISAETLKYLIENTGNEQLGIVTANVINPTGLGRIIRDEFNQVKSIVEEKDATEIEKRLTEINTGIYCIPVHYLQKWLPKLTKNNTQKEYYLTQIISFACTEHVPINVSRPKQIEEIYGTNTRIELARLERIYQKWQAQSLMLAGVTLYDPNRIDIRGQVTPAKDCVIDVNVILAGEVILAENCYIGPNCYLENVKLAPNTRIKANCVIEGAEIEAGCELGPFARIRPKTKLHKNVHIGNFVEIKNSEIGTSSKAGHLSYIGDADLGADVNVGAGTITCNYDGAHKHKTIIEDDVFVGSDTQFVAPVKIGKGATIGAGSTITHNVPPNKLALSRTKQEIIEGWKRPIKNK